MFKQYITLFLIHIFIIANAQSSIFLGASYGESTPFRNKQDDSYYNYSNEEFSLFLGKNFAWKNNDEHNWNKYWVLQINQNFSKYQLHQTKQEETIYSAMISAGLRLEKPIAKDLNLEGTLFFGAGYHDELPQRLSSGLYFREAFVLGLNKEWKSGVANQIGIGFQHASNANIYDLNRGYELLFLRLSMLWPKKSL